MFIDTTHIKTIDIDYDGPAPQKAKKKEKVVDHFVCEDGMMIKKFASFIENYQENVAGPNTDVEVLVTFKRRYD